MEDGLYNVSIGYEISGTRRELHALASRPDANIAGEHNSLVLHSSQDAAAMAPRVKATRAMSTLSQQDIDKIVASSPSASVEKIVVRQWSNLNRVPIQVTIEQRGVPAAEDQASQFNGLVNPSAKCLMCMPPGDRGRGEDQAYVAPAAGYEEDDEEAKVYAEYGEQTRTSLEAQIKYTEEGTGPGIVNSDSLLYRHLASWGHEIVPGFNVHSSDYVQPYKVPSLLTDADAVGVDSLVAKSATKNRVLVDRTILNKAVDDILTEYVDAFARVDHRKLQLRIARTDGKPFLGPGDDPDEPMYVYVKLQYTLNNPSILALIRAAEDTA